MYTHTLLKIIYCPLIFHQLQDGILLKIFTVDFNIPLPIFTILQTKAPSSFDTKLPPITPDDVTFLSNRVPELADKLK